MAGRLLQAIATDLNLKQYQNETATEFSSRVLYSAMSCWIKTACLDNSISGEIGVSRRHILSRCTPVLSEFLKRMPECVSWFEPDGTDEQPVSIIRSRLLRSGDIVNVGFNTNIALADENCEELIPGVIWKRGTLLQKGCTYSGISALEYDEKVATASAPAPNFPVGEWLDTYIKEAWWENSECAYEGFEFFNPQKKTKNNHSCWQLIPAAAVDDIMLMRRQMYNNQYEYVLYRCEEKKIHRIDSFLQKQGLPRKLMITLRYKAGNAIPGKASIFSDHVHLQLWVHLPMCETTSLESYAWPFNNILDCLEWTMPLQLWTYIAPQLSKLGLNVAEENYG